MRIVLISYGDMDYDGRLRSIIDVFSQIGDVAAFTRGRESLNEVSKVCNLSYGKFILESIKFASQQGGIDVLVLDNRKATIPGIIIKKICHPAMIIQDCRELYLIHEVKPISSKIGCIFERHMVRNADVVICANDERSQIMQMEYGLNEKPLTYENLRQLRYESEESFIDAKSKIDSLLHKDEIRIISSSGCSIDRTNDVLVRKIENVKKDCRLYLVGDSALEDEQKIRSIIESCGIDNVEILGRLNQSELKYLISKCDIGIVNYGQMDTNNKLCASGKLYEFLYEGIPVVTTTNPPLKRICEEYRVGVADDSYFQAINEIAENYNFYKNNVYTYINKQTIEDNDQKLIDDIKSIMSSKNL